MMFDIFDEILVEVVEGNGLKWQVIKRFFVAFAETVVSSGRNVRWNWI